MTKTVTPRDVADYWRRWALAGGESFAAHALCMVLDALDGETRPEMLGVDELPGGWQVDDDLPTAAVGRRQAVEEAIQRARRDLPWQEHLAGDDHGGESSVFLAAQPMSSTMRQAVTEAKQRPPARHFEPSTLLEDGGTDE